MERQGARFTTETGLTDQAIYYSDSGIKRAAEYRTQSSWLLNAFSRPDSLDAKWIHKDFLRAVLSGKSLPPGVQFHVPGKYAIAHYLLDKWITESRCNKWAADEIETVQIDEGVFKYVLIRVHDHNGSQKLIVRGNSALAYHADILKQARDKIGPSRLQADPLGGGRIEHHPEQKVIHIYGFSQAYGQANHAVTAALLRQWLPFHEISVSWDGY